MRHAYTDEEFWPLLEREANRPLARLRSAWHRCTRWPGDRLSALRIFYQRGKRGWATGDADCLDRWAAQVLAGMLAYHAAHSKTFPGEHVDFPEGRTPEAWNAYVHGLAQAFEHYITSIEGAGESIYTDEQMEPMLAAMRKLFDHFQYLWS